MTEHSLNFLAVSPQPSPLVRRLAPSLENEMIFHKAFLNYTKT